MTAVRFEYLIKGVEALRQRLIEMTPKIRRTFGYKAMRRGGEAVRELAASPGVVPVLAQPKYVRGQLVRKPGTLRDNIKVRKSREDTREGNVGVFVNVKPAKGENRGANSPNDPYYWRFVHFGTRYMRARPFLTIGAQQLEGEALRRISAELGVGFEQLNLEL
jgi:HK97 gp10 family phage protein